MKHPAEAEAVRLDREGLTRDQIAKRLRTTPNHVWAMLYLARPAAKRFDGQTKIARAIVARKREEALS